MNDESIIKTGLSLRGDLTRILNSSPCKEAVSFATQVKGYVDLGLLHQDLTHFKENPAAFKK